MKEISTKHISIFLTINISNEAFDLKYIMVAAIQVTTSAKEKKTQNVVSTLFLVKWNDT